MINTGKDILKNLIVDFNQKINTFLIKLLNIFPHKHEYNQRVILVKKLKMFLGSLLVVVLFLFMRSYVNIDYDNLGNWGIIYFLLGLFTLSVTYFLIRPFSKHSFFTVGLYPSIFSFLSALTIHSIFLFDLARISYVLIFVLMVFWLLIGLFTTFLMTNVLNVNMFNKIPLSKLAEGVLRIFVLLIHVMIGFLVYIIGVNIGAFSILSVLEMLLFLFILIYIWNTIYRYFTRDFSNFSWAFSIVFVVFLLVFNIFLFIFLPSLVVIFILEVTFLTVFLENFIEKAYKNI